MKSSKKIVLAMAAIGLAGLGSWAVAQPGGGYCDGPMGMMGGGMRGMKADPGARAEQHLNRLKADLKLTPQQEPLWLAFADKVKAEAGKGMQAMRQNMQSDKPVPAPERMTQMEGMMKERLAAMQSVHESFNRLYAALTPEQKAVADRHFSMAGRPPGSRGRGGPPQGQPPAPPAKN